MTMLRTFASVLALLVALSTVAAGAPATLTGDLLALQDGYVFLTTGDVYRAATGVRIVDAATGAAAKHDPGAGAFVELTFDASGRVATIGVSPKPLPPRGARELFHDVMVLPPLTSSNSTGAEGTPVGVTFVVRVPASTSPNDEVYLTDAELGWNPLAIRMDRVDAWHFRATITVASGATFRYLYTRGNSPTIERGVNGLQRKPRTLLLDTTTPRTIDDTIEHWGDEVGNGTLPAPQATPTPYNPAPYPNLPIAVPAGGSARMP